MNHGRVSPHSAAKEEIVVMTSMVNPLYVLAAICLNLSLNPPFSSHYEKWGYVINQ